MNESEKKQYEPATVYLYVNLNLNTVSIWNVRIRDSV